MTQPPQILTAPDGAIANWDEIHYWAMQNDNAWRRTVREITSVTTDEVKLLRFLAAVQLTVRYEMMRTYNEERLHNPRPILVIDPTRNLDTTP